MRPNFRKRLRSGELLYGCVADVLYHEISELLSKIGFDWLLIDVREYPPNLMQIQKTLQSLGNRCSGIVRIPFMDNVWVKKILDTGVDGIIISQVNSAEEASHIVSECKYPPHGSRGVGIARAQMYGINLLEYVETANEKVAVIVQIDNNNGLKHFKSIVDVQGIDAVFFNADNLNTIFMNTGNYTSSEFEKKMVEVQEICRKALLQLGVSGAATESVQPFIDKGFTLIAAGSSFSFLKNGAINLLETFKNKMYKK